MLVSLFIQESSTEAAHAGVTAQAVMVSDFADSEFSAAVARRMRMGELAVEQTTAIFADFDLWITRAAQIVVVEPSDMAASMGLVRQLELGLRAPDALHLAVCRRVGGTLFTFDLKMIAAAKVLGMPVQF